MVRAAVAAERAGVPAVAIHCTGFQASARAVAEGEGLPGLALAEYPGTLETHGARSLQKNIEEVLLDRIEDALTKVGETTATALAIAEPEPEEIIFRGTLDQVNQYFADRAWTDGLPIIPPTRSRVEEFLRYTDRDPHEIIGVLPPANREATVWSVAVNGVMAGCKPAYMPILLAVVEAIADPHFGLQHAGSTAGWSPIIVLNGPIIQDLGFHVGQGVLRPGNPANTTVGRFLRLFMRNVPRFLPGSNDMGTFGGNFLVVLAENEADSPWQPMSVDLGFKPDANVVTVNSVLSMSYHLIVKGEKAEDHLDAIAKLLVKEFCGDTMTFGPELYPMLVLTPVIAKLIAKAGFSKDAIRRYLYERARISAREFDADLRDTGPVSRAVREGRLPKSFGESDDPNRMLPVFHSPDELLIVVSGDPTRNRLFVTYQVGYQGCATSREIKLPNKRNAGGP